ncbi:MAG: tetratricopeptide repeat protein, partial [Smithella sp.]
VTFAVYWQVHQFDFVNIDDPVYVTENGHIQSGVTLNGLRWAFTTTYAEFWHPLTWLSLMLDYQLFGLDPGGYHVTNLILHILSTLLLFWLFHRMTGAIWPSAFIAAFFALHPLHVESVAWIAERKDVLSAFFWLLTLCLYVHCVEKPAIKRYLLVLFSFICGLMSKPMLVTLPVIMILLDYWPLKRFDSRRGNLILWQMKEKIPFFVLSAVFSLITFYAHYKMSVKYFHFPLDLRLENALVSFIAYLEKTFWLQDMIFFYPFLNKLPFWQVAGAAIIILFASFVIILKAKSYPYLFVGWLWYAITILPVIGIIQFNSQSMADRYIYLPSIGISIMLAWGLPVLFKSENMRRKILFPAAIALLIIMSFLTWKQSGYWKNSIELLNHALEIRKDVYVVHDCLGLALLSAGKTPAAIDCFNQAINLESNYANAYNNRGTAYSDLNRKDQAIQDYSRAIALKPDYAEAYYNRGTAYFELGEYQKSVHDYAEAIRVKPDYIPAYYNRGVVYSKLGQYQMAINDYSSILRLKPDYAAAYNNRGAIYFNLGHKELACQDVQKACKLGKCKILKIAKEKGLCR